MLPFNGHYFKFLTEEAQIKGWIYRLIKKLKWEKAE